MDLIDKHYHLKKYNFILNSDTIYREDKSMDDDKDKRQEGQVWDRSSREQSEKNYIIGSSMSNSWNNTKNPNWRNYIMRDGFRSEKLNDPQRIHQKNQVEDTNYNKELLDKD